MLIFISSRHMPTRPPVRSVLKASLRPYLKSSKLGLPTALEDFAWNLGNIVLIKFLNDISMVAAGIYGAILSIELIAVSCIAGVGSGTLTLCSEAVGACNIKKYKFTFTEDKLVKTVRSRFQCLLHEVTTEFSLRR